MRYWMLVGLWLMSCGGQENATPELDQQQDATPPVDPSQTDLNVSDRIKAHLTIADQIVIDGSGSDWLGISGVDFEGKSAGSDSLTLNYVAMLPTDTTLYVLMKTKAKPVSGNFRYWFNYDYMGASYADIQIGAALSGDAILWYFEEGKTAVRTTTGGVTMVIGEVVEIKVDLALVAGHLPSELSAKLGGLKGRTWSRVFSFSYDTEKKEAWGPAAASYILTSANGLDSDLPTSAAAPLDLAFPLKSTWYVAQGPYGSFSHQNQWAYDLSIFDASIQPSSPRDSQNNSDYFAFGQSIYAPIDGTIAQAVNSEADHGPQKSPDKNASANSLAIKSGAYLVRLLHSQQNSQTVAVGSAVHAGDSVAKVGNSGFSTWAHLHLETSVGSSSIPVTLKQVKVALNLAANDPWTRALDHWAIREGYFVTPIN